MLCLNRALGTSEWLDHFKDPIVHHLVESTSDHCIFITTNSPHPSYKRIAGSILRLYGPKGMIAEKSLMLLGALAPLPPLQKGLLPTSKDV